MTKSLYFILIMMAFCCGNHKKTPSLVTVEAPKPPSPAAEVTYVGTVAKHESCGFVIQIELDGKTISVAPKNLDERYQKSGTRVKFTTSDVLDEKNKCANHYVINISYVTPLRG